MAEDERTFLARAEAALDAVEAALEAAGLDVERLPGDILEVTFDDDSQMIINRHLAAREIWVAARAGGFHYRHDPRDGSWRCSREGGELFEDLSRLASAQAGVALELRR